MISDTNVHNLFHKKVGDKEDNLPEAQEIHDNETAEHINKTKTAETEVEDMTINENVESPPEVIIADDEEEPMETQDGSITAGAKDMEHPESENKPVDSEVKEETTAGDSEIQIDLDGETSNIEEAREMVTTGVIEDDVEESEDTKVAAVDIIEDDSVRPPDKEEKAKDDSVETSGELPDTEAKHIDSTVYKDGSADVAKVSEDNTDNSVRKETMAAHSDMQVELNDDRSNSMEPFEADNINDTAVTETEDKSTKENRNTSEDITDVSQEILEQPNKDQSSAVEESVKIKKEKFDESKYLSDMTNQNCDPDSLFISYI